MVYDPKYIPYLRFQARHQGEGNTLNRDRYDFVHHANGRLWKLQTADMSLKKVKHNRKIYRQLILEVREHEPLFWNMDHEFEDQRRNRKFKVYKDPTNSQKLLLGHKGKSVLSSGIIHAPYIPKYNPPMIGKNVPGIHPPFSKQFKRAVSAPVNIGISSKGSKTP
jgi:hypothetical protein